ncbi:MAG: hypothetical protein Q9223_001646 [Gallowayella weberi]
MTPWRHLVLLEIFLLCTSILAFPSEPEPAASLDQSQSESLISNETPSSNGSTSLNYGPLISCNGTRYRAGLRLESCEDAVSQIPRGTRNLKFGLNTKDNVYYDVPIPTRFISGDGLCTIDIVLKNQLANDRTSYEKLAFAASELLRRCVRSQNVGGIAMDIGVLKRIGLIMTSYDPRVTCHPGFAPPVSNCQNLLDTMTSSQTPRNYGPKGDRRAYVQLPKELLDQECLATVRTTGQLDVSTSYEIWQAIVALKGMEMETA